MTRAQVARCCSRCGKPAGYQARTGRAISSTWEVEHFCGKCVLDAVDDGVGKVVPLSHVAQAERNAERVRRATVQQEIDESQGTLPWSAEVWRAIERRTPRPPRTDPERFKNC